VRHFLGFVIVGALLIGISKESIHADPVPKDPKKDPIPTKKVKPVPSKEEIEKAIQNLGNSRFQVREQASKFLWEAGSVAEAALMKAAKSEDSEIATRASAILEKFEWGLYPDMPPKIASLVESFRTGDDATRQNVVDELFRIRPIPLKTLQKVIIHEKNNDARLLLYQRLAHQARESLPEFVFLDKLDDVEALLETALTASVGETGVDYAAFMLLTNKVDAAIARWEKERDAKGPAASMANETLIYLYRVKKDWDKALEAAQKTKNEELIDAVLWEQGNWKELAKRSNPGGRGNNDLGYRAALYRLSGNQEKLKETFDDIQKTLNGVEADFADPRTLADALFLNGKTDDGIKLLIDKKSELAMAFDLLGLQMKYKEAFALVEEARKRDTNPRERNELEIRRARQLYLLGDKDSAIQLFTKSVENIKEASDIALARLLIRSEAKMGLKELAMTHTAQSLEALTKLGQRDGFNLLFEPIFNKYGETAELLWTALRQKYPKEEATKTMSRVQNYLTGKAKKELPELVTILDIPDKFDQPPATVPLDPALQVFHIRYLALAEVFQIHDQETDAAKYYQKAIEGRQGQARLKFGDYLFSQKKYALAAEQYLKEWEQNKTVVQGTLALYLRARCLMAMKNPEGQLLADRAFWMSLGNEYSRSTLADELSRRDWPEAAQREAEMILRVGWYRNWYVGNALSLLARIAVEKKEYAKAADYYERGMLGLMKTGVTFVEPGAYIAVPEAVRVNRSRALLQEGKIEDALKEAKASLKVMPGNIDLVLQMRPELLRAKKTKEADELFQQVRDSFENFCKEYPKSAYAHNSAAWLLANVRKELDSAINHAEQAIKLEPTNAGYLDTLAEAHFRNGNKEKAIELMKKCIDMDAKKKYYRKQLDRFQTKGPDSDPPLEDEEEDDGE
jgi:predicted Zn-dependent protease/Tfp pilus assembly protein PilF